LLIIHAFTMPIQDSQAVVLKSAQDGTMLELFDRGGDYFGVRIDGPAIRATAQVYDCDTVHLKEFFADMAAQWKGWPGEKGWQSLEQELKLAATNDSIGHIRLAIQMRSGHYEYDWTVSAAILLEAGQLDGIAKSVAEFLDL
jgi:hypothetical protein